MGVDCVCLYVTPLVYVTATGTIGYRPVGDCLSNSILNIQPAIRRPKDFWRDEIKQVIQQLEKNPSMAVDILAPIILEGKAVKDSAYCLNHGKVCKLRVARRHIAGTSCVGFSQKGSGLMLADPSIVHTLCWIALRLHCCEADITQENVARCPVDLFSRFMAGVYFIDRVKMDAVQFGIACGRERQFIRFRHRSKIMSEVSPLSSFMKRFFRAVEYSWREHYFINPCADESAGDGIVPNEALEDLLWAASRPSSCAQQLEYDLSLKDKQSFIQALTPTECLPQSDL